MKNLPNQDIKNIICLLFVLASVAIPVVLCYTTVPPANLELIKDVAKSMGSVSLVILGHYLQVFSSDGKKIE